MQKIKALSILIFLFVSSNFALAQYTFINPEFCIGINQGVVLMPRVEFTPNIAQEFDVRYNGGISFRYIAQKFFGVQAELNYTQRGWKEKSATGEIYSHRLDYLELPLVAHIYFGNDKYRFFINMGPKIKYMISDYSTPAFTDGGVQQSKQIENRFDYSVFGGLGVEFRNKKVGFFQIEARYDYGFGNIFNSTKDQDFTKSNNSGITVSIVYFYDLMPIIEKNKRAKLKNLDM